MKPFEPLNRKHRISEDVAAQLKAAILSGLFRPGQKIPPERELTHQFGVSRMVVREALRELELKGFVKIQQGPLGGAYVLDLSFDHLSDALLDLFLAGKLSVTEVIQVRLHIEQEIARLAAANTGEIYADRLRKALEQEMEMGPSHTETVARRFEVDRLLAEMCGNRLYQALSRALLDLTREIIMVVKASDVVIFNHEEHVEIVSAVLRGDPDAAAEAVKRHIKNVGDRLAELETAYRKKVGLLIA